MCQELHSKKKTQFTCMLNSIQIQCYKQTDIYLQSKYLNTGKHSTQKFQVTNGFENL